MVLFSCYRPIWVRGVTCLTDLVRVWLGLVYNKERREGQERENRGSREREREKREERA